MERHRFKQTDTLENRLLNEAKNLRESAEKLRPGVVRDAALKRARQMETAAHMNEWLSSPGLEPPR